MHILCSYAFRFLMFIFPFHIMIKYNIGNCDSTIIVYTLIWWCLFLNKFGYVYAVLKMIFFLFINALLANFFTRERLLFENFPTFGCRTHNLVLSNTQRRGIKKQFKPKKPFENFPPTSFLLLIST